MKNLSLVLKITLNCRYLQPISNNRIMKDFSYITNSHPSFVENLYREYVNDPQSVDPELKKFFQGFDFSVSTLNGSISTVAKSSETKVLAGNIDLNKEFGVYQLISAYRKKAHL